MAKFDLKKAILENKATFHSSLTEGQFSWFTQDTDQQIGSEDENTLPFVYMHDDKGNKWLEKRYEGYGVFGGKDYYELLDQMNGGSGDRSEGIRLAFDDAAVNAGKVKFPALTVSATLSSYHDFTEEAKNDPNQSWYQEPEEDDYNGDDYGDYNDDEDEYLQEADKVKEAMEVAKDMTTQEASGHAERFARYMSDKEGNEFTVTAGSVEGPSFDLDLDGEKYDGGSYIILTNGDIVNVAVPNNPVYANISMLNEAEKPKTKMKKSELKDKIKEMVLAEIALDIDNMEDAPESEVDFLSEIEALLAEADEEAEAETTDAEATDVTVDDTETTDVTTTAEVDPNVKAVQDALTQAQAAAQTLGDAKLTDQIGNTITFFTRSHVVDKGAVAEADEMEEGKKSYYKDAEADDAKHIKALEKDMEDDKESSMKIKEVIFPMWTKLNK
jgi:hypothetical protein